MRHAATRSARVHADSRLLEAYSMRVGLDAQPGSAGRFETLMHPQRPPTGPPTTPRLSGFS